MDIATRVYNHKWKIDPIVRSLIDTDFYKLLMCQSVFRNRPNTRVRFSLINRSAHVPLARLIDEGELREQLDHIRSLSLSRGESTWLRGNMFYGKRQMFRSDFMEWFETLRLPPYELERKGDQYELSFEGTWPEVMLWEIPALAVLMELRSRAVLNDMGRFELQVLYARAMTRVWEKIERLRGIEGLSIADFGTRRRHLIEIIIGEMRKIVQHRRAHITFWRDQTHDFERLHTAFGLVGDDFDLRAFGD